MAECFLISGMELEQARTQGVKGNVLKPNALKKDKYPNGNIMACFSG